MLLKYITRRKSDSFISNIIVNIHLFFQCDFVLREGLLEIPLHQEF